MCNFLGLSKTPIYIAFHEQKPVVGRKAKELLDSKPNFVVYGIIFQFDPLRY